MASLLAAVLPALPALPALPVLPVYAACAACLACGLALFSYSVICVCTRLNSYYFVLRSGRTA